eukprot:GEMP01076568.1.p1 GENE.GEMP01076568.1~~GEMP01076568.1.p1  ORF type:complete len:211 (+),score=45.30 GEMP01076568.1:70-702(+)
MTVATAHDIWHAETPLQFTLAVPPVELEVDHLCVQRSELLFERDGQPKRLSLGNLQSTLSLLPPSLAALVKGTMRLLPKDTTVRHIDLLDYGPKTLLGWHQDSFSIDRHTFTVVTTIVFRGRGGVDYAPIERKDGVAPVLGSIAMCFPGVVGSVQVHGVAVNNAMAHRGRQVSGRRVCFVLFCRYRFQPVFFERNERRNPKVARNGNRTF